MNLYFQHSDGRHSLVAENVDPKDALSLIYADVAKRNPRYEIYYVRRWERDGVTTYDVGSHTEFYVLKGE